MALLVVDAVRSVGNRIGSIRRADDAKSAFFFNDDGDRAVFLLEGPFHERQLQYAVDVMLSAGVTTLVYCPNFGSDQAYYPSKVPSPLG